MISASQASSYKRCPQAWFYRYVEGRKVAPAWAIKGRGQHKGLAHNFGQKTETRKDLPVADVLDAFRTEVEASFQSTTEEVILFPGESKAKIVDDGTAGLKVYQGALAPNIQPVMVEEWVEATLPWGSTLKGALDLVDETLTIRDSKFPADPMKPAELVYEGQPPLYSWLYHKLTGEWPAGVRFDVVSLGRAKEPKPKAETIPIVVTPERVEAELRDLKAVEDSITAGVVYRRPSAMNCNRCGHRSLCWGRSEPPAAPEVNLEPALQASLLDGAK